MTDFFSRAASSCCHRRRSAIAENASGGGGGGDIARAGIADNGLGVAMGLSGIIICDLVCMPWCGSFLLGFDRGDMYRDHFGAVEWHPQLWFLL